MQETDKKEKIKSKKIIIMVILIVLLASCIVNVSVRTIQKVIKKEEGLKFYYEISSKVDVDTLKILIYVESSDGLEYIQFPDGDRLNAKGKSKLAIDYEILNDVEYKFMIKETGQEEEKERIIYIETLKIEGKYELVDGVYLNIPDLSGFVKENTRYLYLDENLNLVPGNWLTGSQPENWYSYRRQNWANIYVEANGVESYYVWIPRYVYKIDEENSVSGNERMDVKFVDIYNNYKDAEGNVITWAELKEQGYQIPEAFRWENIDELPLLIPGYWMSKYQLSELGSYKINYDLSATQENFNVKNFANTVSNLASKYTYAINGNIVHESATLSEYLFTNLAPNELNTINITALDTNGSIVGSMTKKIEPTEVNPPDLTGFDKDTTFYVYWDEEGNEHNEIPISQEPPEEWYNYTYSQWANIVTRNNGIESYYVWIPRYQYMLDQTSQRADVQFILGTGTDVRTGYQIPEAFTWGDNGEVQIKGYWMSKYQLTTEESSARVTSQITAGSNFIRVGDITGTLVKGNIKYEYYINGKKVHDGTSNTEKYTYTGLNFNTEYVVNIILRNADTNAYIGAITQKIKTIDAYEPDLTGFDKETTFYVIYNSDGTEKERVSIKEEAPSDWYDYSNRIWANIVTTANGTESYFVWIPRYEYRILENRDVESLSNKRTEVNFVTTEVTNENGKTTPGYQVPEAFSWGDNGEVQIKGYWMSKYQLK